MGKSKETNVETDLESDMNRIQIRWLENYLLGDHYEILHLLNLLLPSPLITHIFLYDTN